MQPGVEPQENPTLTSVRTRSVGYLGYLFWVLLILCALWTANALASLIERWVAMLHGIRHSMGFKHAGHTHNRQC